jgi:nucleoside-diphosphate-sugar epimerase
MRVVIAGGHGQVARHIERLLTGRGDEAVALIRNTAHAKDVAGEGAEAVVLDLEAVGVEDVARVLDGADAAVFAAGAGPGSGAERKKTVDLGAAVLLADACTRAGVRRLVVISAIGADRAGNLDDDDATGAPSVFKVYLQAKAAADAYVRDSGLDWTIVRPGGLTDDPPTGRVAAAEHVHRGSIPRADVAAVVLGSIDDPHTIGKQFEVVGGGTPVDEALAAL